MLLIPVLYHDLRKGYFTVFCIIMYISGNVIFFLWLHKPSHTPVLIAYLMAVSHCHLLQLLSTDNQKDRCPFSMCITGECQHRMEAFGFSPDALTKTWHRTELQKQKW